MGDELDVTGRTMYQKDLYGERVTLRARVDTDHLDHGDNIRITVEKVNPPAPQQSDDPTLVQRVRRWLW